MAIPKRIQTLAYRMARERKAQTCQVRQEHNKYIVILDGKKHILGRAKVRR